MYFTAHLAFQGQQVGGTNSIQSQLDLCKAYCTEYSYTLSEDQMYYELKEGTVEIDHPELGHPRKAVPPGFIDVLVVASLGRLTRDDRPNVILIEQLKAIGLATEATEKHRAKKNESANALSSQSAHSAERAAHREVRKEA